MKAAKRKVRTAMTTEQIALQLLREVKAMSADEKAKLRALLTREFGPANAAKKLAALQRLLDAALPRRLQC
jgi:hypothetical protein